MKKFTKQPYTPRSEREKLLAKAFASLKTEQEVLDFLRDLLTPAEFEEFANRIEIARLLLKDNSYQEIAKEVGTSTTTVTRVAQWLFSGSGGYATVLSRLFKIKI